MILTSRNSGSAIIGTWLRRLSFLRNPEWLPSRRLAPTAFDDHWAKPHQFRFSVPSMRSAIAWLMRWYSCAIS